MFLTICLYFQQDNETGVDKATKHNSEDAQNPAKQLNFKEEQKSEKERLVLEMCRWFYDLLFIIRPFQELWSNVPSGKPSMVTIPDKLVHAWLSLVVAVVLSQRNESRWRWYMSIARNLVKEGTQIIMQSHETTQLPFNKAVVQPKDLAALILLKLAQHALQPNGSAPPYLELPGLDIARVYHQHLRKLVSRNPKYYNSKTNIRLMKEQKNDMMQNPSLEMRHKVKLDFVEREITTIRKVISDQQNAVSGILPAYVDYERSQSQI